jgi:hypothetical protein
MMGGFQPVSNIIDFLERMGADAQLRGASPIELEAALIQAGLGSAQWIGMVGMNQRQLESLLGARSNVCCLIVAPDEEQKPEEEEEEPEEEDGDEENDDKVKSRDRVRRSA